MAGLFANASPSSHPKRRSEAPFRVQNCPPEIRWVQRYSASKGRTLTSYPSVRTELRNAGATVVDEEVVIDGNLISSRSPDDLPAFCNAIVDAFAKTPAGAAGR